MSAAFEQGRRGQQGHGVPGRTNDVGRQAGCWRFAYEDAARQTRVVRGRHIPWDERAVAAELLGDLRPQ